MPDFDPDLYDLQNAEQVSEDQLRNAFPLHIWSRCYCGYAKRYERRIAETEAVFTKEYLEAAGNPSAEKVLEIFSEEFKKAWERAMARLATA